ncbi:MAG: hypothetical protein DLM57_16810 [Pseudonocardiales bacterium]|nr:MAG: hypothetical protein DLM57_16810 [Pseudonocardiales bacterium]
MWSYGVEPVHPIQHGGFEVVAVAPGPGWSNQFGLAQADLGLGQGVDAPMVVKLLCWLLGVHGAYGSPLRNLVVCLHYAIIA